MQPDIDYYNDDLSENNGYVSMENIQDNTKLCTSTNSAYTKQVIK